LLYTVAATEGTALMVADRQLKVDFLRGNWVQKLKYEVKPESEVVLATILDIESSNNTKMPLNGTHLASITCPMLKVTLATIGSKSEVDLQNQK